MFEISAIGPFSSPYHSINMLDMPSSNIRLAKFTFLFLNPSVPTRIGKEKKKTWWTCLVCEQNKNWNQNQHQNGVESELE